MTPSIRSLLLAALAVFLLPCLGCDDAAKKAKECANHCAVEAETCQKRHEPNCETRGRECAEGCERVVK